MLWHSRNKQQTNRQESEFFIVSSTAWELEGDARQVQAVPHLSPTPQCPASWKLREDTQFQGHHTESSEHLHWMAALMLQVPLHRHKVCQNRLTWASLALQEAIKTFRERTLQGSWGEDKISLRNSCPKGGKTFKVALFYFYFLTGGRGKKERK